MSRRSPPDANGTSSVVLAIVEALETHGMDRDTYQLHRYVDPDALDQLVTSLDDPFSITFTVETVQVEVTQDGVSTRSVDQSGHDNNSM